MVNSNVDYSCCLKIDNISNYCISILSTLVDVLCFYTSIFSKAIGEDVISRSMQTGLVNTYERGVSPSGARQFIEFNTFFRTRKSFMNMLEQA